MPWQQHVANVILEIDPVTRRLAYSMFGLTVPRQSGKSTFILAKAAHRASAGKFFGPRQNIVYTAQTRLKAREKWEEDFAEDLVAAREFRGRVQVHKSNGHEHIRFGNRSRFGIEANTEKAGHGSVIDEAYIDEAFAQVDARLEQAFRPAMITRANKQLGVVSTAGWLGGSPYLESIVARGRAQAEMGVREGFAYFEWSAAEDADPEDRDVWRACMPALGWTISEQAIADELRDMDRGDFRRAYLNQWVPKLGGDWRTVPELTWRALGEPDPPRPEVVAFAAEVSWDDRQGMIGAAGRRADGLVQVELAEPPRDGTDWVVPRLLELRDRWSPCAVVIDPGGPGRLLIDAAAAAGLDVAKPVVRDVAAACGQFTDLCRDSGLRHLGQPDLSGAVAAAVKHEFGALWAWERKVPQVSPLMAVTLALWGLERFGPGGAYDAGGSVHMDVGEVARLVNLGVYGPADVERLRQAGIPVPTGN